MNLFISYVSFSDQPRDRALFKTIFSDFYNLHSTYMYIVHLYYIILYSTGSCGRYTEGELYHLASWSDLKMRENQLGLTVNPGCFTRENQLQLTVNPGCFTRENQLGLTVNPGCFTRENQLQLTVNPGFFHERESIGVNC